MSGTSPETSASDAAARVSLPFTMSNIFSLRLTYQVRRFFVSGPSGPAPFRERRRCMPFPTRRQPPFFAFFCDPSGSQKPAEQSALEPLWWPAKQRLQSAGRVRICPEVFSGKAIFHQSAKNLPCRTTEPNELAFAGLFSRLTPVPRRENMHLRNIPAGSGRSWPSRREAGSYGDRHRESSPIRVTGVRQVVRPLPRGRNQG